VTLRLFLLGLDSRLRGNDGALEDDGAFGNDGNLEIIIDNNK